MAHCRRLRSNLGILILMLAVAGRARADKPLTEEHKAKLKERDRLDAEATKLGEAGKLDEMVAVWEKKLALERAVFGDVHEEVAASLAELGAMHEYCEDFDAARKARKEVLTLRTKLHGKQDWRVTDARLELQDLELRAKLDAKSRRRLVEANTLSKQVVRLEQQGRSRQALPLARQALAIRREVLGEDNRTVAQSLFNLGAQYRGVTQFTEAEHVYLQARDLTKKLLTENHPDYAMSLNELAALYVAMGDYSKALPLLEQARESHRKLLTENHPAYATSLNNLALLYQDKGDYGKALSLYEQARDLYKKLLTENHPAYATSLNNLAVLYKDMGDYGKALPLYEQAR